MSKNKAWASSSMSSTSLPYSPFGKNMEVTFHQDLQECFYSFQSNSRLYVIYRMSSFWMTKISWGASFLKKCVCMWNKHTHRCTQRSLFMIARSSYSSKSFIFCLGKGRFLSQPRCKNDSIVEPVFYFSSGVNKFSCDQIFPNNANAQTIRPILEVIS